jgi:hypothetical protein
MVNMEINMELEEWNDRFLAKFVGTGWYFSWVKWDVITYNVWLFVN